jgi:hypothetical protein
MIKSIPKFTVDGCPDELVEQQQVGLLENLVLHFLLDDDQSIIFGALFLKV